MGELKKITGRILDKDGAKEAISLVEKRFGVDARALFLNRRVPNNYPLVYKLGVLCEHVGIDSFFTFYCELDDISSEGNVERPTGKVEEEENGSADRGI